MRSKGFLYYINSYKLINLIIVTYVATLIFRTKTENRKFIV